MMADKEKGVDAATKAVVERKKRWEAIVAGVLGRRAERASDWVVQALTRLASDVVSLQDKLAELSGPSGKSDIRVHEGYNDGPTHGEKWRDIPSDRTVVFFLDDESRLEFKKTHSNAVQVRASHSNMGGDTITVRGNGSNEFVLSVAPWRDPALGKDVKRH